MSIKGFIAGLVPSRKVEGKLRIGQKIFLQIGGNTQSFITIIENLDEEFVCVAGITNAEINFIPLPGQMVNFFFLINDRYFKAETTYVKQISSPVYQWVLKRPVSMNVFKERRYAFRLEKVLDIDIKNFPKNPRESYEFLSKNLSAGGVMLITKASLSVNSTVTIELSDISKGDFFGVIVWKDEEKHLGKWHYGIKFLNMTQIQREELAHYIAHSPAFTI